MYTFKDIKPTTDDEAASRPSIQQGRFENARLRVKDILVSRRDGDFDEDLISSLMESFAISADGPFNPVIVRRATKQEKKNNIGKFVLLAGNYRFEAATRMALALIDCRIFLGSKTEAKLLQLEENLFRKGLTVLASAENLCTWVELAVQIAECSGQVVRNRRPGAPKIQLSTAAKILPAHGRSIEARRKVIARAMKIASICPDAKKAAKTAGLDNNQSALLQIAKAGGRKRQLKMVKQLADRMRNVVGAPAAKLPDNTTSEAEQAPTTEQSSGSTRAESSKNSAGQIVTKVPDTTLDDLEKMWKTAGGRKLWAHAPVDVRNGFMEGLRRARCKAEGDIRLFIRKVFFGRQAVESRYLFPYAKTLGFSKKTLKAHLKVLGYRSKKRDAGRGSPWTWRNVSKDWKDELPQITNKELEAPYDKSCSELMAERDKQQSEGPESRFDLHFDE